MFFRRRKERAKKEQYLRNFVFGVEDSLASTVGLLSGVAAAGVTKKEVIITGVVLIFVEAFSMGVGSLLSEHSVEEYERRKTVSLREPLFGAGVMFLSYLGAGILPLFPYLFFQNTIAFWSSIILSLGCLFALGIISAAFSKTKLLREGYEMLVIGGIAVFIGVVVGTLMKSL